MVLQQLGRQANRIRRNDGAVGPDFERELVVVGNLPKSRRFHRVVALAHRRVDGINRNKSDAEIFVEIFVGGNVAASALQPQFHVKPAAFADGGDVNVLVQDFDVPVGFDHARSDHARLVRAQIDGLGRVAVQLERDLFQVQDDVSRVLDHAGDGLELVQHAFDFDSGNRGAFDRRQQHAAKRIADRCAEPAFKRLRPENSVLVG